MGSNKNEEFSLSDNRIAAFAKALAHPARVAIMRMLSESGTCVCGELVTQLPLSQATISQHLKELKDAGLIKGSISGRNVCYCVDPDNWLKAGNYFQEYFKSVTKRACC